MTIRAERDPRYYRRFILIGLAALGFALWSLYDGKVKYPAEQVRALAYQKLVENEELDEADRREQWNGIAAEHGWPTKTPEKPKEDIHAEIMMQYVMAGMAGSVAFLMLFGVWRSRGRWIESSESGLTSSWGQSLGFDQVLTFDKRQWRSKGIAKVKYRDGKRKRRFVIDNYKFDQHSTNAIVRELEANIGLDQIVNGPPEPPPEGFAENPAEVAVEEFSNPD